MMIVADYMLAHILHIPAGLTLRPTQIYMLAVFAVCVPGAWNSGQVFYYTTRTGHSSNSHPWHVLHNIHIGLINSAHGKQQLCNVPSSNRPYIIRWTCGSSRSPITRIASNAADPLLWQSTAMAPLATHGTHTTSSMSMT